MRVILAQYISESCFRVPKNVPLLSKEDNENKEFWNKPWSWWIKWDTLHYIDDKGVEHSIQPEYSATDYDYKRPSDISEDEEPDDEDD